MQASQIRERPDLTVEEVKRLAEMISKSYASSPNSPAIPPLMGCPYQGNEDKWHAFICPMVAVTSKAGYFLALNEDGVALCSLPGSEDLVPSLAGSFTEAKDVLMTAEDKSFLEDKYYPAIQKADEETWARDEKKANLYLALLAVAAGTKGKGVGGSLLTAVFEKAKYLKCNILLEADNLPNVAYYERRGFTVVNTAPLPDRSGGTIRRHLMRWNNPDLA